MSAVVGRTDAHLPRVLVVGAAGLVVAFAVQTAVLPALGLSAAVPVVFTAVAVLGAALGVRSGAAFGFAAGLLLDLTGVAVLGVGSLVGCLLGAIAGQVRVSRWRWSGLLWIWGSTAAAALIYMMLTAALAELPITLSWSWLWIVLGALVCAVALVPLRPWLQAVVR